MSIACSTSIACAVALDVALERIASLVFAMWIFLPRRPGCTSHQGHADYFDSTVRVLTSYCNGTSSHQRHQSGVMRSASPQR
jgi:hypothetical protein